MLVRMSKGIDGKVKVIFEPEYNEEMAKMETYCGWTNKLKREVTTGMTNIGTCLEYVLELQ